MLSHAASFQKFINYWNFFPVVKHFREPIHSLPAVQSAPDWKSLIITPLLISLHLPLNRFLLFNTFYCLSKWLSKLSFTFLLVYSCIYSVITFTHAMDNSISGIREGVCILKLQAFKSTSSDLYLGILYTTYIPNLQLHLSLELGRVSTSTCSKLLQPLLKPILSATSFLIK